MKRLQISTLLTGLTIISFSCFAAVTDTIGIEGHQLNTSVLKTGLNKYMVYYINPATPKKITFWYWQREIKKRQVNGSDVFEIVQHWYGADTATYRYVISLNDAQTFMPLFHQETVRGKAKAYNWSDTKIIGDKTIAGNAANDFKLDFERPNYNWNLDMETFEMLPLASGKTFAINFYDAGLSLPKYVLYTVTSSEIITTMEGRTTDCWKLYTEGKSPDGKTYNETYWISKKGHEFLKEVDEFGGTFRYKVKMPEGAPDAASIFFQN